MWEYIYALYLYPLNLDNVFSKNVEKLKKAKGSVVITMVLNFVFKFSFIISTMVNTVLLCVNIILVK